jgi:hypothetical protein
MKLVTSIATFFADRLKQNPEVQRAIEAMRDLALNYLFGADVKSVTATGAAQEISGLPFDDVYAVFLVNTTTAELTVHFKGMAAGSMLEIAAAAVYGGANGITLNSGITDNAVVSRPGSIVIGTGVGAADDVLKLFAIGK